MPNSDRLGTAGGMAFVIASLSGIGDDEQADALVIPRGQTGLVLVLGLGLLGTPLPAALVGCAPLTSNAALRE